MFSKPKNKGKGVGKGQSNRHKNERHHRNVDTFTESHRISSSSRNFNRNENPNTPRNSQNEQRFSANHMDNSKVLRTFSKDHPLMADLVWKSVQPTEECIPR